MWPSINCVFVAELQGLNQIIQIGQHAEHTCLAGNHPFASRTTLPNPHTLPLMPTQTYPPTPFSIPHALTQKARFRSVNSVQVILAPGYSPFIVGVLNSPPLYKTPLSDPFRMCHLFLPKPLLIGCSINVGSTNTNN